MAIDPQIVGMWQSQGDLPEYLVFHADGTYQIVIPGVPVLGAPDSTHGEGRFRTDPEKKPAELHLEVGGGWQFFIFQIHGEELWIDGGHGATAGLQNSGPRAMGAQARRFSRVQ
jgi:hypothetical protein